MHMSFALPLKHNYLVQLDLLYIYNFDNKTIWYLMHISITIR